MDSNIAAPSELNLNTFVGDSVCGHHVAQEFLASYARIPNYDVSEMTQT